MAPTATHPTRTAIPPGHFDAIDRNYQTDPMLHSGVSYLEIILWRLGLEGRHPNEALAPTAAFQREVLDGDGREDAQQLWRQAMLYGLALYTRVRTPSGFRVPMPLPPTAYHITMLTYPNKRVEWEVSDRRSSGRALDAIRVWCVRKPTIKGELNSPVAALLRNALMIAQLQMNALQADARNAVPLEVTEVHDSFDAREMGPPGGLEEADLARLTGRARGSRVALQSRLATVQQRAADLETSAAAARRATRHHVVDTPVGGNLVRRTQMQGHIALSGLTYAADPFSGEPWGAASRPEGLPTRRKTLALDHHLATPPAASSRPDLLAFMELHLHLVATAVGVPFPVFWSPTTTRGTNEHWKTVLRTVGYWSAHIGAFLTKEHTEAYKDVYDTVEWLGHVHSEMVTKARILLKQHGTRLAAAAAAPAAAEGDEESVAATAATKPPKAARKAGASARVGAATATSALKDAYLHAFEAVAAKDFNTAEGTSLKDVTIRLRSDMSEEKYLKLLAAGLLTPEAAVRHAAATFGVPVTDLRPPPALTASLVAPLTAQTSGDAEAHMGTLLAHVGSAEATQRATAAAADEPEAAGRGRGRDRGRSRSRSRSRERSSRHKGRSESRGRSHAKNRTERKGRSRSRRR